MNVSLNWLSTHVDLRGKTTEELDALLTFAGVEVEGIEVKGISSDQIVVAQIREAVQHPNADRLKVTQVDAGEGELRQIVCGAKNYQVGDKVPCALPGAALPAGFTIGETKMRGVDSRGMLCAAAEIGLVDAADGLLILPADAPIGAPVKSLFASDVKLKIEVTPNRPDLLSHRGMAREMATLLRQPLLPVATGKICAQREAQHVVVDDVAGCPFYTVTAIAGVKVAPSPAWLVERLESIGLRSINSIVDVTNFVMHELGQPLHAFDAAKVRGKLVVRSARAGENFLSLDDKNVTLNEGDVVISDESGEVLALAGVMGGKSSGVTDETTSILLESAYFAPSRVRRAARAAAISTDSSYRFERGADPMQVVPAAELAVEMIVNLCGLDGDFVRDVAGEIPVLTQPVVLDVEKMNQLMGGAISLEDAEAILTRLGLEKRADGAWAVPSFRADLQRHIDLVEEIARVFGLENVPSRLRATFAARSAEDAAYDADLAIRRQLVGAGFFDCQTIKLISDAQLKDALPLRPMQDGDVVRVKLPLSEDHAVMRPSLVPGLIASAERNLRQGAKQLRLMELGRAFRHAGGGKSRDQENDQVALLLHGLADVAAWNQATREMDLFDLKAAIQCLVPQQSVQFLPKSRDGFSLAGEIQVNGQNLGVYGRLSLARERELGFGSGVFVAELDAAKLRKARTIVSQVDDLPQFPGTWRDAAMEVASTLASREIDLVVAKSSEPFLTGCECFDEFRDATGEKLALDRKSLAYRFSYRATDRTLTANEVDEAHQRVLQSIAKALPVKFRD